MTQEQKAKAYDKVREKIALRFGSNVAEEIFSEFVMTEDERIKKDIISFLRSKNGYMNPNEDWDFHNVWLPWLEKQGEKPTDKVEPNSIWNEEDEKIKRQLLRLCEAWKKGQFIVPAEKDNIDEIITWLKQK